MGLTTVNLITGFLDHGGDVVHEILAGLPVQRGAGLAALSEPVDTAGALQVGVDVDLQLGRRLGVGHRD